MALKFGKYRHFKGGEYEVIGIAKHSESHEDHVVYSPLYGEHGLWVRPLVMFEETVTYNGEIVARFQYVGD